MKMEYRYRRPACTITVLLLLVTMGTAFSTYGQVSLEVAMSHSNMLANQKQKGYLRIGLIGQPSKNAKQRAPVNVAVVLDRSGSMGGAKIENAKEAAIRVIERLSPDDIVSVVAYDDQIYVLAPATKAMNRDSIYSAIRSLTPGASTALYAGVTQGASEVRKFRDDSHINRVVLLSDGLANVGPESVEELGDLGASLGRENISVTTIGLGLDFNEDLMTRLAAKSDGNHMFAETPADVQKAFQQEFDDVLSVVAKNVGIYINLDSRIHPVRAMGREVEIHGQSVYAGLNQLYAGQTKYVLLEVEIEPMAPQESLQAASVRVTYANPVSITVENLEGKTSLAFSNDPATVQGSENKSIMECVLAQRAVEENEQALRLRDQGRIEESRQALQKNAQSLQQNAVKYNSPALDAYGKANQDQAEKIVDPNAWQGLRKSMSKGQYDIKMQTGK